jgi:hypothetical protein
MSYLNSYSNTSDFKNKELGNLGEKIIANYFTLKGKVVLLSEDLFDRKRDLLVDGKDVEVKTLVPMIKDKSFMVKNNQLEKIMNSYRTYFIAVPLSKLDNRYGGKIYELDPKTMITKKSCIEHLIDGNTCIPIDQEAMTHIHTITNENTIKYMKNLSTSNF